MTKRHLFRRVAAIGFGFGFVFLAALPARGQTDAADAARLIRVLEVAPGQTVAEIGAGTGALTVAIAR